jgi:Asp-tRNA(Asn)/Glu-tRNA(Gln) amidotransferase A subunit family amidase
MLETAGWTRASDASKIQLNEFLRALERMGVRILDRSSLPLLQEIEDAISDAFRLSQIINAWESRWPLNTYAERDRDKLSAAMQKRLVEAESMSLADYVAALDKRQKVRSLYTGLAAHCGACITLSAPGAAPPGLASTGDPIFAVVASLLGVPALSLPLLEEARLPLGLQLIGYAGRDADLISNAAWVQEAAAQAA